MTDVALVSKVKCTCQPDATNNIQLVVCWSTAVCPCLTCTTFPSLQFSERESFVLHHIGNLTKRHNLPTVIVPVA